MRGWRAPYARSCRVGPEDYRGLCPISQSVRSLPGRQDGTDAECPGWDERLCRWYRLKPARSVSCRERPSCSAHRRRGLRAHAGDAQVVTALRDLSRWGWGQSSRRQPRLSAGHRCRAPIGPLDGTSYPCGGVTRAALPGRIGIESTPAAQGLPRPPPGGLNRGSVAGRELTQVTGRGPYPLSAIPYPLPVIRSRCR
jgi:hypothetical protein